MPINAKPQATLTILFSAIPVLINLLGNNLLNSSKYLYPRSPDKSIIFLFSGGEIEGEIVSLGGFPRKNETGINFLIFYFFFLVR